MKKKTMASVGICAIILASAVGYTAYNEWVSEEDNEKLPLNPMKKQKEKEEWFVTEESDDRLVTEKPSKKTSLSDGREVPMQSLLAEKEQAYSTLNQQIANEQKKNQQTAVALVSNERPSQPTVKEEKEEIKPTLPIVPEPTPEPSPEPLPPIVEPVDYTELALLVDEAERIDTNAYMSWSVATFEQALASSKQLLAEQQSTQEEVNHQTVYLRSTMNELIRKGDKTSLNALYRQTNQFLVDEPLYTEESVQTFRQAQQETRALLAQEEVIQEELDAMETRLNQAFQGLEEKEEPLLSLVFLERKVDECSTLDFDRYTEETALPLQEKLSEVNDYIAYGEITQEQNEDYIKELETLKQALVEKEEVEEPQEPQEPSVFSRVACQEIQDPFQPLILEREEPLEEEGQEEVMDEQEEQEEVIPVNED